MFSITIYYSFLCIKKYVKHMKMLSICFVLFFYFGDCIFFHIFNSSGFSKDTLYVIFGLTGHDSLFDNNI